MDIDEAIKIVLTLAESKWIWRIWKWRLTDKEMKAIRIVSAWVEHGKFK